MSGNHTERDTILKSFQGSIPYTIPKMIRDPHPPLKKIGTLIIKINQMFHPVINMTLTLCSLLYD